MRGLALGGVLLGLLLLSACSRPRCCRRCVPCRPCPAAAGVPVVTPPATNPVAWRFLARRYDADGDGEITRAEYTRADGEAFGRLDGNEDDVLTAADFEGPSRMDDYVSTMILFRYFRSESGDDADGEDVAMALTREALATRFAEIDANHDGDLSATELDAEREAKRDIESPIPRMPPGVNTHHALLQVADGDNDGRLTAAELLAHFDMKDTDGDGLFSPPKPPKGAARRPRPKGPAAGEAAPDFTLRPPDGGDAVTLSAFAGERPVALLFGSYT